MYVVGLCACACRQKGSSKLGESKKCPQKAIMLQLKLIWGENVKIREARRFMRVPFAK